MKTFGLRSLREGHLGPHELAIAKSPCLHSVCVAYDNNFSRNGLD